MLQCKWGLTSELSPLHFILMGTSIHIMMMSTLNEALKKKIFIYLFVLENLYSSLLAHREYRWLTRIKNTV